MKIRKITLLSAAAMTLGAALLLVPNAKAADEKTNLNTTDTRFIQNEVSAGIAIVEMSELAVKKAKREEIKSFAGMLVTDHNKANAELSQLATTKNVELSSEPAAKYGDMQDKLERTSGADFDKEYLAIIVSGHEKCVKRFEEASSDAEDSDLKAWAAKMLPAQQAHLQKAEELHSILTTRTNSSSTDTANTNSSSTEPSATQADNTARNKRDRDMKTSTPLDQGNSQSDIDTTAKIRREVVDLDGLSVNAQNVKIITNEGRVTLRGPVDSADEKRLIGEIATRVATSENTTNQLEVRSAATTN